MKVKTYVAPNGKPILLCPVVVHIDGEMAYDEAGLLPHEWDLPGLAEGVRVTLVEGIEDGYFQQVDVLDTRMIGRVYHALRHYRQRMDRIRERRGNRSGIMVHDDELAVEYQGWDRVVTLLEDWLQTTLGYDNSDWIGELYPPPPDPWKHNPELGAEIAAELERVRGG